MYSRRYPRSRSVSNLAAFIGRLLTWSIPVVFVGFLVFWPLLTLQQLGGTVEKTVVDRGNTYFVIRWDSGNTEILENEDALIFFKFNSGNVLMNLEAGKHYTFKVAGLRIPFLSKYRNIIAYQETGQ
jgi:hypothetical protein